MFKDLKISMLIFMGMNWPNYKTKTFRKWAGYACGYHFVKHYLKKTGKSIIEATLLPAKEILDAAEDFWND